MAKFLFTMLPANDLGLPSRLVPIARALADRGHDVALFNPAPAPARLIAECGLRNLPMPARSIPEGSVDLDGVRSSWDVEHMFGSVFAGEESSRAMTALHVDLFREHTPDVVVDSFGIFGCLAARIVQIPLVSVLQGNFHPKSNGFLWWESERPADLPSAASTINIIRQEYGLPPIERCVDVLAGDLCLIVGSPETDPLPPDADVVYVGPIVQQRKDDTLPRWLDKLDDKPLIWVYCGNPRYGSVRRIFATIRSRVRRSIVTRGNGEVIVQSVVLHPDVSESDGTRYARNGTAQPASTAMAQSSGSHWRGRNGCSTIFARRRIVRYGIRDRPRVRSCGRVIDSSPVGTT
jgi:UDP:flavonoid glycosyltransferase YjiC (YdhE family)